MIVLPKNYAYMSKNGKRELTPNKLSPSSLRRANVPDELIEKYQKISNEIKVKDSFHESNQGGGLSPLYEELELVHNKIVDFLKEQEENLPPLKTSPAQRKASDKWGEKNKEYYNYIKKRSSARSFIKNNATLEDLEEIETLVKERKITIESEEN